MINRVIETSKKIKKPLRDDRHHLLPIVIIDDLMRFWKLPLCLFICIIVTAALVVTIVHYTRSLNAQYQQLILERNMLDIEWRNLVLEKNVLSEHSRVERIATKELHLQHINPSQENIVVEKRMQQK